MVSSGEWTSCVQGYGSRLLCLFVERIRLRQVRRLKGGVRSSGSKVFAFLFIFLFLFLLAFLFIFPPTTWTPWVTGTPSGHIHDPECVFPTTRAIEPNTRSMSTRSIHVLKQICIKVMFLQTNPSHSDGTSTLDVSDLCGELNPPPSVRSSHYSQLVAMC